MPYPLPAWLIERHEQADVIIGETGAGSCASIACHRHDDYADGRCSPARRIPTAIAVDGGTIVVALVCICSAVLPAGFLAVVFAILQGAQS